jgi:membrane-associated phospholipid phosphatase
LSDSAPPGRCGKPAEKHLRIEYRKAIDQNGSPNRPRMTIEGLAELIAIHLWAVLLAFTFLLLLNAWLLWGGLQQYGPAIQARVQEVLARIRPHARRLPVPGAVLSAWQITRRLGLQVLASMIVAVVACVGLIEIADEIGPDEDLGRFDLALSAAFGKYASDEQLRIFALITNLGDKRLLIALAGVVALWLLWRRQRALAAAWIVATAGGGLLNLGLKEIFARSRPQWLHDYASADGWSFPSGHSSGAFIVYGLLAYLAVVHLPKRVHLPVATIAMLLIVCVGFSRAILQVHYFSDVLGGYAVGASWVAVWIAGLEAFRRNVARAPDRT